MISVTCDPPSVSSIPAAAQAELFEPSDKPHRDLGALWEAINQHAIVSMADPAGNITYANETFVRISGYSREELLGQNHRVLKSDVHGPEFWDAMWKTISSGYVWKGVVCNCAKDGSHYWVDTQISPSFGPSGQIEQYMSIRTDITAHKRALSELEIAKSLKAATDALQLRRFYMQATLDNLPFQFWLKDALGRYLAVNQVFADACGYSTADEVTGLTDLELWPSAQAQKYQSIDAEVMGSCLAQTREECDPLGGTGKENHGTDHSEWFSDSRLDWSSRSRPDARIGRIF
jgi:PAS domain S-box-containing protein